MEPEERFERIEATLDRTVEDHRRATADNEKRHKLVMEDLDKRHRVFIDELARVAEQDEKRHKAAMARSDENHRKAMARLDKTEALLQLGARLIAKNAAETRALKAEVRAFIKGLGNGHRGPNGRGH